MLLFESSILETKMHFIVGLGGPDWIKKIKIQKYPPKSEIFMKEFFWLECEVKSYGTFDCWYLIGPWLDQDFFTSP